MKTKDKTVCKVGSNAEKTAVSQGIKEAEELFLSSYSIADYERPSVATDVAVFSMFSEKSDNKRKDSEQKLHILLVKRGEHPFINRWALPGGFVRPNETVEECAVRETEEETALSPVSIMPVGVFSEPDRDPRGRIISNAFASIVSSKSLEVCGGGDAVCAKWFEVSFSCGEERSFRLELTCEDEKITAALTEGENRFGIGKFNEISNTGLAFDHAKIIATALCALRNEAERFTVTFDFLPEKFTLSELQRVQEILTGAELLTANFRRKISSYVEEIDEYTEGVVHRPARLFKKK